MRAQSDDRQDAPAAGEAAGRVAGDFAVEMRAHPVSTRVSKPANDDARLLEEVEHPATAAVTPKRVDND